MWVLNCTQLRGYILALNIVLVILFHTLIHNIDGLLQDHILLLLSQFMLTFCTYICLCSSTYCFFLLSAPLLYNITSIFDVVDLAITYSSINLKASM